MNRLDDFWHGRGGIALRRGFALLIRAAAVLGPAVVWQFRVVWARISPRARIFAIILGLVLLSAWTSGPLPGISEIAHDGAVLILAFVGFWWILTAPFPRRRWW